MSVFATDDEIAEILGHAPAAPIPPKPRPPAKPVEPEAPPPPKQYSKLEFDTPLDLLLFIRANPYPHIWQEQLLAILAGYFTGKLSGPKSRPTERQPLYLNVAAANGSGKDAYIIAPFAIWFCCSKIRSRCIVTSASYEQLKHQTFSYMCSLAESINAALGEKIFDIVEFKITCLKSGSEIKCFATNEAGKAEGYHPFPDFPDCEMAFIANEAKSIEDSLFTAFSRFTGYNYWLEISSPGPRAGHFFKTSVANATINHPLLPALGKRFFRRISAFECPHISPAHIAQVIDEYGENSPLVRSSIFAEFSDLESFAMIKEEDWNRCFMQPPAEMGSDIGIGLDVAGGGDENACFVRQGNKTIHKFFFTQTDTTIAADLIDLQLHRWKDKEYDFRIDNGGLGQGFADALTNKGWRLKRCNNQSPARNKRLFTNLGAENWHKVKRHVEKRAIILPSEADVPKLKVQATSRFCDGLDSTQGRISLESKKTAIASGRPSPDRADAFVLCFCGYRETPAEKAEPTGRESVRVSPAEILALFEDGRISYKKSGPPPTKGSPTLLSVVNI